MTNKFLATGLAFLLAGCSMSSIMESARQDMVLSRYSSEGQEVIKRAWKKSEEYASPTRFVLRNVYLFEGEMCIVVARYDFANKEIRDFEKFMEILELDTGKINNPYDGGMDKYSFQETYSSCRDADTNLINGDNDKLASPPEIEATLKSKL